MYPQFPKKIHFFLGIALILCLVFLLTQGRPSLWTYEPTESVLDSLNQEPESILVLVDSTLAVDSILVANQADSVSWRVDTTIVVDTFWNAATPPIVAKEATTDTTPNPPIKATLIGIAILFLLLYLFQKWLFKKREQKYWLQYQAPLNNLYPDEYISIPTTAVVDNTVVVEELSLEEQEEPKEKVVHPLPEENEKPVIEAKEPVLSPPTTTNLFETTAEKPATPTKEKSNIFLDAAQFPIHLIIGIGKLFWGLFSFLLRKTTTLPSTNLGWKDIVSILFLLGFIPIWNIFIAPTDSVLFKIFIGLLLWLAPSFLRSDWKAAVFGIFLFVVELSVVGIYLLLLHGGEGGRFPWEWIIGFSLLLGGVYQWFSSNQNDTAPAIEPTPNEDIVPILPEPIATEPVLPVKVVKEEPAPKKILLKNPKDLPQWWKKIDLTALLEIDMAGQQLTDDSPLIETYLISAIHLERIHFQGNQLESFPVEAILLEHLVYLNLSDNAINFIPTELKYNDSLDMLLLNNNNITSISNAVLARLRHLLHLEIKGNPLDEYTLNQLKTTFPNTTVLVDEILQPVETVDLEELEKKAYELLSEKLKNPTAVTFCMEFSDLGWEYIPNRPLDQLKNIAVLYLSNNKLKEIPTVVFELKKLRTLHLRGNEITSISPTINRLKHLNFIGLNYNPIHQLPSTLSENKQLKRVSLSNCKFKEFPMVLTKMPHIKVLELESNEIREIPREIGNLTQLTTLNLDGNPFTSIPKEIGKLQALEKLLIGSLNNKHIPKEIFQLKKLKSLNIRFTNYPKMFSQIAHLTALEHLDIGFSKNINFESDFFEKNLPQIKKLHLSGLSLTNANLPSLENLDQLTDLWVSHNKLTQFPEQLAAIPTLKLISLDDNDIKSIPASIVNLKNLETLFLSNNKNLATLPQHLLNMPKIKWISISNTNISAASIGAYEKKYPHIRFDYN